MIVKTETWTFESIKLAKKSQKISSRKQSYVYFFMVLSFPNNSQGSKLLQHYGVIKFPLVNTAEPTPLYSYLSRLAVL